MTSQFLRCVGTNTNKDITGRRRGPPVRGAGYEPVTGNSWQSQETSTTRTWNAQRVRKSKGTPSNAVANTSTCDDDAQFRSPRDSPRRHRARRGPLVDALDNACRTSRASHKISRLSASAAARCFSQSPAVRVRRLSPDNFPQYSQQHTATDGPGAGPSKHLPTSAMSHAGKPSDRTASSLRESITGHRHATHRCHKILQIHRQPRPLSLPKPLVKDWSPLAA